MAQYARWVSGFELLQRLDTSDAPYTQRWLVRAPDREAPHIACYVGDDDPDLLARTEQATQAWLGPIHPRIAAIHGVRRDGNKLVIETEDDRGPAFVEAARQLTDPVERERWAIAQIIGVADGLATMRQRDRSFVHRRLEPTAFVVDIAGHVRLRAPIPIVEQGVRANYVGRSRSFGIPWSLSPEQVRGLRAEPPTDVFALACTLHHALSGQHAFRRDSDFGSIQAIVNEPPPPLAIQTPGVRDVLDRAFAKDPQARWSDAGTFAGELWRCVPDAMEYDAVISDRIVAWRATAEPALRASAFSERACRMRWDELLPGASADLRHCTSCAQDVVRVTSLAQIVPLVGRCVAYSGGD